MKLPSTEETENDENYLQKIGKNWRPHKAEKVKNLSFDDRELQ
jgi:hypothetical protein